MNLFGLVFLSHLVYGGVWIFPNAYKSYCDMINRNDVNVLAYISGFIKMFQFLEISTKYTFVVNHWGVLLVIMGQLLNGMVYLKLGIPGVYYGGRLGYKIPWITEFPYNFYPDPQYLGAKLTLMGAAVMCPQFINLAVFWAILYDVTGIIEKNVIKEKKIVKEEETEIVKEE